MTQRLAILAGSGTLPATVAKAAVAQGRNVFVIAFAGFADMELLKPFPHGIVRLGMAGKILALLRQHQCSELVMIGGLVRPAIRHLGFDLKTLTLLPRVFQIYRGGDNHLLSSLADVFEDYGVRVVGAHDIAPEILMPSGVLGGRLPDQGQRDDIEYGLQVISALGPYDVGQGVVVFNKRVLAVEAAEGTDAMLSRIGEMQQRGRLPQLRQEGVFVKAPKPAQDRRIDLPAIGGRTVEAVVAAGLAGIAVAAGSTIVAEPQDMIAAADKAGVFVLGVDAA